MVNMNCPKKELSPGLPKAKEELGMNLFVFVCSFDMTNSR